MIKQTTFGELPIGTVFRFICGYDPKYPQILIKTSPNFAHYETSRFLFKVDHDVEVTYELAEIPIDDAIKFAQLIEQENRPDDSTTSR